MKTLYRFALAIPLAAAMLFAQDPQSDSQTKKTDKSRTTGQADVGGAKIYTGTILDANCSHASSLMGTESSSTSSKSSVATAKREALKMCQPTASTTSYAILTDDGHFLKLDSAGNDEVNSKLRGGSTTTPLKKNTKASVNGTVEGDTLKVQSLTKL
jgi:hypothetical protein